MTPSKRILNILLAMAAVLVTVCSCGEEDPTPTANFQDRYLIFKTGKPLELVVNLNKPAPQDLSIEAVFTSESKEYAVSDRSFRFSAGETQAKIKVTDQRLQSGASITVSLIASKNAYVGLGGTCILIKEAESKP